MIGVNNAKIIHDLRDFRLTCSSTIENDKGVKKSTTAVAAVTSPTQTVQNYAGCISFAQKWIRTYPRVDPAMQADSSPPSQPKRPNVLYKGRIRLDKNGRRLGAPRVKSRNVGFQKQSFNSVYIIHPVRDKMSQPINLTSAMKYHSDPSAAPLQPCLSWLIWAHYFPLNSRSLYKNQTVPRQK